MMASSSLSSKVSNEFSATNVSDIDVDKKRRQLLIRSAKRPFKRSRLVQQKGHRKDEDETDTVTTASLSSATTSTTKSPLCMKKHNSPRRHKRETPRKRRMVSFETKYNETTMVPSHNDLSETERRAYYFQRDEYVRIKRNIQRTIGFLQSPSDASGSESASQKNNAEEEHCVRGLECLASEYVNDHKKRVQKSSKSAVFSFQRNRRRSLGKKATESKGDGVTSRSILEDHEAILALAETYKKYTAQSNNIARRWGHFDAIDVGIDPTQPSTTAVTCATASSSSLTIKEPAVENNIVVETTVDNNASLSSLSYDGDDGEEDENESNDSFIGDSATNGFDSLPSGLLNF
jgi:hypothetical protein